MTQPGEIVLPSHKASFCPLHSSMWGGKCCVSEGNAVMLRRWPPHPGISAALLALVELCASWCAASLGSEPRDVPMTWEPVNRHCRVMTRLQMPTALNVVMTDGSLKDLEGNKRDPYPPAP